MLYTLHRNNQEPLSLWFTLAITSDSEIATYIHPDIVLHYIVIIMFGAEKNRKLKLCTYVSIKWSIPEAKNLKLRQSRGISTALANQTGFPWSRDSAAANSSNRDSTISAIFIITWERSLGVVCDHLRTYISYNVICSLISTPFPHPSSSSTLAYWKERVCFPLPCGKDKVKRLDTPAAGQALSKDGTFKLSDWSAC